MLRGRVRTTTYLYEDPEHPDRVTGAVESPVFTEEDRALLLALALYEGQTCAGCSEPIDVAWHCDSNGWYESESYVCMACTTRAGEEVAYTKLRSLRDDPATMRPFVFGETTTPPAKP